MRTVKGKVAIFVLIAMLCISTASTAGAILTAQSSMTEDAKNNLQSEAYRYANELDVWMTEEIDLVRNVAISLESLSDKSEDNIMLVLDSYYADRSELLNLYFGSEADGSFKQANREASIPDGYDPRERGWYKSAEAAGSTIVTDPYWDVLTNQMCDTIACPVYEDGQLVGTVAIDLTLATITEITSSIHYEDGVYAFLTDASDNYIYHPNEEYMPTEDSATSVRDTASSLSAIYDSIGSTVIESKDYEGTSCYFATAEVGDTGFNIGIAIPVANVEKETNSMTFTSLGIEAVALVIGLVLTLLIIAKILKPLDTVSKAIISLRQGDLSQEIPMSKGKDDISQVQNKMSELYQVLSNMIKEANSILSSMADKNLQVQDMSQYPGEFETLSESVNHIKDILTKLVKTLQTASEEVHTGTSQLALAADSLAQSTTQEAMSVQNLQSSMENIDGRIVSNRDDCGLVGNKIAKLSDKIEESNEHMHELQKAVNSIENISADIQKIVDSIDNIAFQTNILALNASVEAARAGEAGKGFAVVAEEVRNLAQKSAEESGKTAELITATVGAIAQAKTYADSTTENLQEVVADSREIAGAFRNINDNTTEQADSSKSVVSEIVTINDVIQSNTATAQETAASCEELSGQARQLMNMVNGFRV